MPPPKKSNTGLIIGLVIGGIFLCCILPVGALFGGGFWLFNKAKDMGTCFIAFENVKKAVVNYASAHDGKLPKADTWQDDVRDEYRKVMIPKDQLGPLNQMPAEGDWGCKDSNGIMSGMAFNSELSGKKIGNEVSSVLIYETEHPSKNQHAPYKRLDPNTSPLLFGQHRGWCYVTVGGELVIDDPRRGPHSANAMGGGFNVQSKSDSSN
jgi:hypothetical protein